MSKTFEPYGKRLLVEVAETQTESSGGILLPTEAQKKQKFGIVISVGDIDDIKESDIVYFADYAGTQIPGTNGLLLTQEDIVGILRVAE